MSATVFGICFGSSSAVVAACRDGRVQVLANEAGERATPALVAYLPSEKLVGHAAKHAQHQNLATTAAGMAALLGHKVDDPGVSDIMLSLPCKVVPGEDGGLCYQLPVGGEELCVPVHSPLTEVFRVLWKSARSFDSRVPTRAVLAVPAHYTEAQRELVSGCASEAGFQVMRVVRELPAACLAYGIGQQDREYSGRILVYDLGMMSLTITLLEVNGGLYRTVSSHTVSSRGGRQFDCAIGNLLASEFQRQCKVDIRGNSRAMHKLLAAAEVAKHSLSINQNTTIHLDSLHEGIDFQYTLTRGRFEGVCSAFFRSCLDPIPTFLASANTSVEHIDKVLLSGGSTKLPRLQQLLQEALPSSTFLSSIPPDEVVAVGAAKEAEILATREGEGEEEEEEEPSRLVPCASMELCIAFPDSANAVTVQLMSSNTPLPCQRSVSAVVKPSQPRQEKYCIELREGFSSDRVVVKMFVPVLSEQQVLDATLIWQRNNHITVTISDRDSDWSRSVQLQCEAQSADLTQP